MPTLQESLYLLSSVLGLKYQESLEELKRREEGAVLPDGLVWLPVPKMSALISKIGTQGQFQGLQGNLFRHILDLFGECISFQAGYEKHFQDTHLSKKTELQLYNLSVRPCGGEDFDIVAVDIKPLERGERVGDFISLSTRNTAPLPLWVGLCIAMLEITDCNIICAGEQVTTLDGVGGATVEYPIIRVFDYSSGRESHGRSEGRTFEVGMIMEDVCPGSKCTVPIAYF